MRHFKFLIFTSSKEYTSSVKTLPLGNRHLFTPDPIPFNFTIYLYTATVASNASAYMYK